METHKNKSSKQQKQDDEIHVGRKTIIVYFNENADYCLVHCYHDNKHTCQVTILLFYHVVASHHKENLVSLQASHSSFLLHSTTFWWHIWWLMAVNYSRLLLSCLNALLKNPTDVEVSFKNDCRSPGSPSPVWLQQPSAPPAGCGCSMSRFQTIHLSRCGLWNVPKVQLCVNVHIKQPVKMDDEFTKLFRFFCHQTHNLSKHTRHVLI